jgi:hypothetical protein
LSKMHVLRKSVGGKQDECSKNVKFWHHELLFI